MENKVAAARLNMINGHVTCSNTVSSKAKIIDDVWASVNADEYLSEKGVQLRRNTRDYMNSIETKLVEYVNKAEFPFEILEGIRALGVNGFHIKDFGGPGINTMEVGAVIYEMAKVDCSISSFMTIHNSIGMAVIDYLGSEE